MAVLGPGKEGAAQVPPHLLLSPCPSPSFSQHQVPSFMGLTCHWPQGPRYHPVYPLKLQMRKPKSRAMREVPVSQGRSFDYFAPSLSLPHHYFFPFPTCSALKLQQLQGTVKVHHRWGLLKAPHGYPWSLPPKGAFVIEGRGRSSLILRKGERVRKGGHGPGGQGNGIGFGLSALPRACWAVWGAVLSLFVSQRV